MKKIKLLITINFLTYGGPSRVVQNLVKSLNKDKYEITVLTLINENNSEIIKLFKNYGVNVIEMNLPKSLKTVLKNRKKFYDEINGIAPNIIHTHGIVSTMLVASKSIKAKKVSTIHNNIFEDYSYTYGKIKGKIYALLNIIALKKFDKVIGCSKTSYEIIKKYIKKSTFILNGIDFEKNISKNNTVREELGIPIDSTVFVYVGVINNRKRVVELCKLMNSTLKENEYLIIVGDGDLKMEAEKFKSEQIKFVGFQKNVVDFLNASNIYVSYSSSEGFSISVIEALSNGLYCLLSDIPSHKECFEIDDRYYIGEYFNKDNFEIKKNKIVRTTQNKNKEQLVDFQKKYLSSIAMSSAYEKEYDLLTVEE